MEPLLYIGISQSLFAAFLVLMQRPIRPGNRILGLWLILIAVETAMILFYQTVDFSWAALNISIVLQLAYMPLMYLYVNALILERPHLFRFIYKHLPPFLIIFILIFSFRSEPLFWDPDESASEIVQILGAVFWIYFIISIILYTYLVLKFLKKHQEKIEDRFSYRSEQVTLNWLKFVIILFFLGFILGQAAFVLNEVFETPVLDPRLSSRIALTIFTFVVSYYGIRQPSLNVSPPSVEDSSIPVESNSEKYQRSGLTEEMATDIQNKLENYMIDARAYQNPKLTINDISKELDIPRHYITQVLNERMQKNFFTWINDYRINDVKAKLKDKEYSHLTVVALAYESGFNSKSSFNMVFKKSTGKTPSEYSKVQS